MAVSCGRSPKHTALFKVQVLVVAAAGNSASDWCTSIYDPVTTPDKLLVGATTKGGALASFSNYGACVHVQVLPPRRLIAHSARNPLPPPPRLPVHACPPVAARPHFRPSPQPRPCRTEPPPRLCTGPRLPHPGCVGGLKQHRHRHHQWHQHGGATCLRRRRPAARGRLNPLSGAGQGDDPRRRGGGLHRPFCKGQSR